MSVKNESVALCVCEACLSSGRRLVRLDALKNIYASVLSEYYVPIIRPDTMNDMSICWECTALLKRVLQFKLRAARAQQWLHWARSQDSAELISINASLSSLLSITKSTYDVEVDSEQSQIEIKQPIVEQEQKDISKVECDSDHYEDAAAGVDKGYYVKLEPVDTEIFTEVPVVDDKKERKRSKKAKLKKTGRVKIKREVKKETDDGEVRRKRAKASPFDNYTINAISPEEVERQRAAERSNVWYIKSPHKCETCIYGFRSLAQYRRHSLTNHAAEAGSYICHICETRAQTKKLLDKHIKVHTEQYECNVCGATFGRIHTVRQHFTAKHKTRKCKYCSEEFYDLKDLYVHRRVAHLNFQCDKCGKKTTSKYTLKKHLRTHEPYPCAECDSVFNKKKNLDQHVRNRHETRASEAYCVECDRQFASRPSYLLHVTEKHSPAVRFRCPECDKPFNRKAYMKNHYNLMHLKKTNYYCKLCDKYICRKDGLRKHIEFVHEGKRLPKNKMCDICGRGFSTNKTLIHHRRTHTGERPHQCEYCTAAFAQVTALKTHVKHIHLQLKRSLPHV